MKIWFPILELQYNGERHGIRLGIKRAPPHSQAGMCELLLPTPTSTSTGSHMHND